MIVSISISLFLLQVIFMKSSNCDYYTSIAGLDNVLSVEFYLIELFDVYITQAEEVNNAVKRIVFDMEKEMNSSLTLLETHYQNPLHAFKILKRLVVDWKQVEKLFITNEIAEVFSQNLTKLEGVGFKWPTREDLQGASNGLVRLQQTYNISTNDIANGTALGKVLSRQLSAADCFELGVTLYETSNFQFAIEWLMKAKVRLENESLDINYTLTFPRVFDAQILHYLSLTMFSIGNLKMAQRFNFKLLIQDPESQEGLQNKIIILQNLLDDRRTLYVTDSNQKKDNLQELYEKVCRKEITQTPTQQRVLHCRYVTNNTPFATIAPFKMEILNQDPLVAYYHELDVTLTASSSNDSFTELSVAECVPATGLEASTHFDSATVCVKMDPDRPPSTSPLAETVYAPAVTSSRSQVRRQEIIEILSSNSEAVEAIPAGTSLSTEQIMLLQEAIIDVAIEQHNDEIQPEFEGCLPRTGWLLIVCSDAKTAKWVKQFSGHIGAKCGLAINVVEEKDFPRTHIVGLHTGSGTTPAHSHPIDNTPKVVQDDSTIQSSSASAASLTEVCPTVTVPEEEELDTRPSTSKAVSSASGRVVQIPTSVTTSTMPSTGTTTVAGKPRTATNKTPLIGKILPKISKGDRNKGSRRDKRESLVRKSLNEI
ncbi:prolyl 4-hydroxylase subunit alpha-2-like [Teleopsis dalmanni]|uniref:prolyl 4-hydroxylase subunit alpha-2-like n=1 Tax=Teleopsis dalmanni TaxID=139649 RepID=UPI0018CD4F94|nr:prolyl 4-hydroxylase subunit alpha-2-like [Teleopsis dalmanni]